MDSKDHTIFYSSNTNNTFGTEFVVREDLKGVVMGFQPLNVRMCTLRIRARFFSITFICVHVPTEEADDEDKESFYDKLEATYNWVPGHDVKIVLGDTNAKIGKRQFIDQLLEGTVCIRSATTTE
jgi:exonuclease III